MGNENLGNEKVKICKNCGAKNKFDANFCSSCGAKLQPEKIYKNKPKKLSKKTAKNITRSSHSNELKILSTKNLISIIVVLFIIGAVILISGGAFNSPVSKLNNLNTKSSASKFNNGIDLSNINRIKNLENVVAKNPNDSRSLLELAHLLDDSGFFVKAIQEYNKYLKFYPNNPDALIDRGVCYYKLKQYDKAIVSMKKAVKIKPDHQIGNFNLGIVNMATGNMEKAKMWWRKAVAINPNSTIGKKAKLLLESH